jgi:predicted GNAT family acetyltransferase
MIDKTRPALNVVHNTAASRFEVEVDGRLAICDYRRQGKTLVMPHTVVPPELSGRGIAAALVAAALAWARSEGLRVQPTCSYVAAYMQRHTQTQDLLA